MAAEAVATSLAGNVVTSLLQAAKKDISYMCNCAENVEKFRHEVEKLKHMKGRVQQRIDIANDNGEDLLDGVQEWVDRADAQISMAEEFLVEHAAAKKTCFNLSLCVNVGNLHHYGKKAVTKANSLVQYQKDGERFEETISVGTTSPRLLDVYQKTNLDGIVAHKLVLRDIVQAIEDEHIHIVGVYGLGGVGKTTLVKEALEMVKNRFSYYVFTTISQNVDVEKVKKEVKVGAKRILKGERILVMLDDMWKGVKLEDLGIPDRKNCKILLTTRSRDVCKAMNADRSICVNPLSEDEAWNLFKRVTGEQVEIDNKLKGIATEVCVECGGLPLFIQAVGKVLKDKEIDIWKVALNQLQKHAPLNISPDIREAFTRLKLSFDHLESEEAKCCFLLCSIFPEDCKISLDELAHYGVGLELFNDLDSVEDARSRVRIIVNNLESSFLLLNVVGGIYTSMHDVVRDVALLIASEGKNKFLVESGKGLTEWLPRTDLLDSYTRISLMHNKIKKLPDYELNFPHLDAFLIQGNRSLLTISEEFIQSIKEVKVLDMRSTSISFLPQSMKLLTKLRLLSLKNIEELHEISIIGELKNLEILFLNGYAIKKIPEEIGQLVKLRRLDIDGYVDFHDTLVGVISKLRWLEELCIGLKQTHAGFHDFLVKLMKLSKLTYLMLSLPSLDVIPEGLNFGKLKGFKIRIGRVLHHSEMRPDSKHELAFAKARLEVPFSKQAKKLLEVSTHINMYDVQGVNGILSILNQQDVSFNRLESFSLVGCKDVESLVEYSSDKELGVRNCPNEYASFCNISVLNITYCDRIERVFSVRVAQGLVSLQKLDIRYCDVLEEVIFGEDEESESGDANIVFPSLANITLHELDSLKTFYSGSSSTIKYPFLVQVDIKYCKRMEMWGKGIHDTPKLKLVGDVPLNVDTPTSINDAVAKIWEGEQAKRTRMELEASAKATATAEDTDSSARG